MGYDPIILGRFNYLSVRENLYNVLFFPFTGTSAAVIARNLERQTALNMITELNGSIDDTNKDLSDLDTDEY